ncbi:hypothetical protein LINPERPRIM_LOCUS35828, partial [Linum perenne]
VSRQSYIGALNGSVIGSSTPGQSWIPVGVSDIVPACSNGIKSLSLSKGFKEKLCKPWSHSVVVRLLGKSIGYSYLCHRLRAMWKPTGNLHIVDLDKSCFLVKFSIEQDYFKALTGGGAWILLDHYLVVHQWDPSFRVSNDLPKRMVAWIRFPHLPIHLYHGQVLTALGNLVGKTVKIDSTTQSAERGKFARIVVEIDLDKPLPPIVLLDGAIQQVEYENLPQLCFDCGLVGHERLSCPRRAGPDALEKGAPASPSSTAIVTDPAPAADSYGPWMLVSRSSRRSAKVSVAEKVTATAIPRAENQGGSSKIIKEGGFIPQIMESEQDRAINGPTAAKSLETANEDQMASPSGPGDKSKRKPKKKSKAKSAVGPQNPSTQDKPAVVGPDVMKAPSPLAGLVIQVGDEPIQTSASSDQRPSAAMLSSQQGDAAKSPTPTPAPAGTTLTGVGGSQEGPADQNGLATPQQAPPIFQPPLSVGSPCRWSHRPLRHLRQIPTAPAGASQDSPESETSGCCGPKIFFGPI